VSVCGCVRECLHHVLEGVEEVEGVVDELVLGDVTSQCLHLLLSSLFLSSLELSDTKNL